MQKKTFRKIVLGAIMALAAFFIKRKMKKSRKENNVVDAKAKSE